MRFTVNRDVFSEAVSFAAKLLPQRPTQPGPQPGRHVVGDVQERQRVPSGLGGCRADRRVAPSRAARGWSDWSAERSPQCWH